MSPGGNDDEQHRQRDHVPEAPKVLEATERFAQIARLDCFLIESATKAPFLIDLSVPRTIESSVGDLDGVFCYDIDDLRSVVDANLRERQREAQRAEALVEREVAKFIARLRDLEVVPTIVSLREKLEAMRRAELDKALARLPDASEETRQVLDALTQAIINKVLHGPIVKLKDSSRAGHHRRWTESVSELFGLGRNDGAEGPR